MVVEKYPLPVDIRLFLRPCLRISPMQSAWYHYIHPPWSSYPLVAPPPLPPTCTRRVPRARTPHSRSFSSSARRKQPAGVLISARRGRRTVTRARWRARARSRTREGGRAAGGRASRGARKAKVPTDVFFNY